VLVFGASSFRQGAIFVYAEFWQSNACNDTRRMRLACRNSAIELKWFL
jgi:hypothetical protein